MDPLLSCSQAAAHVAAGAIIAYPTEAIYGLGCDPRNEAALNKLITLKHRSQDKGLIVIASQLSQLHGLVEPPHASVLRRVEPTWPGPVTWIMPATPACPAALTGGRNTIAVRVSAHPVVRELCDCANSALVSTSANTSGQVPLQTADAIIAEFGTRIAGVVRGELGGLKNATSIFDASTGVQLR